MKSKSLLPMVLILGALQAYAHDDFDFSVSPAHAALRPAARYAIQQGDTALFDALLKAGLQINEPLEPHYKELALHTAVESKNPDMIRYLLDHGANPLLRADNAERPIDKLEDSRANNVGQLVRALERKPTDHDKKQLMQIPVPVWHELLGATWPAPDPLAPPVDDEDADAGPLITFVSINDEDPPPEMTPALNAHFPGWRPGSRLEMTAYRDKETRERGELIQIILVPCPAEQAVDRSRSLAAVLRENQTGNTAYQFSKRRSVGPVMAGSGQRGHVLLVAGYWVKVGVSGWDE